MKIETNRYAIQGAALRQLSDPRMRLMCTHLLREILFERVPFCTFLPIMLGLDVYLFANHGSPAVVPILESVAHTAGSPAPLIRLLRRRLCVVGCPPQA